jgi:hypothetical protein
MRKITLLCSLLISGLIFAQVPDTAPPAPTEAQVDVVSVFSDAFTGDPTITPTTFGQSSNTAQVVNLAGNDVYEFTIVDGDFQGFEFGSALNLSQMENLHYDVWIDGSIPVGNVFNTTVSYHSAGHLTGQTTGYVHTNASIADGQDGQWLSFDISFSSFAPDLAAGAKDIISQMVFSYTNYTSSNTIYVDNIYFWRDAVDPNQDATLSDLAVDGTTINNFSPGVIDYDFTVPNGTSTVPTVTATPSQAGSTISITDAAGIPGTTSVMVTAPDGNTTETYTVNFEEEGVLPPSTDSPEQGSTGDDLIVYSGITGESTVANFNFNAFAGNGVAVSEVDVEGNGNNAGLLAADPSAFWFYGAGWDAVDLVAGGYQFVHLNYYATNSTEFNFYLIDATAGIGGGAPEEPRFRFGGATPDAQLVTGSWQSVYIPLSHFENFPTGAFNYDLNDIFQYKFDGNGTIYFDNIYFSTTNTLGNETFSDNGFLVYPNPSKDNWNFKSTNAIIQTVDIFNTLGRLVKSIEVDNSEVRIDASDLSNGIYFAKINSQGNNTQTIKLIKQ